MINRETLAMMKDGVRLINLARGELINSEAVVQAIKDGKVGYTIYTYESHAKTCYGINFVDMK